MLDRGGLTRLVEWIFSRFFHGYLKLFGGTGLVHVKTADFVSNVLDDHGVPDYILLRAKRVLALFFDDLRLFVETGATIVAQRRVGPLLNWGLEACLESFGTFHVEVAWVR